MQPDFGLCAPPFPFSRNEIRGSEDSKGKEKREAGKEKEISSNYLSTVWRQRRGREDEGTEGGRVTEARGDETNS